MEQDLGLREPGPEVDEVAKRVIGAAIEVHRHLGPGFLEGVYEEALCRELGSRRIPYRRQVKTVVRYKGHPVGAGRIDLLVADSLIVELKAVEELHSAHFAQVQSYLKAADLRLGLLMNFNKRLLKDGLNRVIRAQRGGRE